MRIVPYFRSSIALSHYPHIHHLVFYVRDETVTTYPIMHMSYKVDSILRIVVGNEKAAGPSSISKGVGLRVSCLLYYWVNRIVDVYFVVNWYRSSVRPRIRWILPRNSFLNMRCLVKFWYVRPYISHTVITWKHCVCQGSYLDGGENVLFGISQKVDSEKHFELSLNCLVSAGLLNL